MGSVDFICIPVAYGGASGTKLGGSEGDGSGSEGGTSVIAIPCVQCRAYLGIMELDEGVRVVIASA